MAVKLARRCATPCSISQSLDSDLSRTLSLQTKANIPVVHPVQRESDSPPTRTSASVCPCQSGWNVSPTLRLSTLTARQDNHL